MIQIEQKLEMPVIGDYIRAELGAVVEIFGQEGSWEIVKTSDKEVLFRRWDKPRKEA